MTQLRLLVPLLAVPLAAACVADGSDQSIVIIQNNAPMSDCTISASVDSLFLPSGIIDVRSSSGYVLTPVVQNYSVAQTEDDERRRTAFIQGAYVDLAFGDDELFSADELAALRADGLTRFEVPLAAVVFPEGTTSFGMEVVPDALFDEIALGAGQSTLVLATIRLHGELGSSDFESQSFRYPVELCNGCLTNNVGSCAALPSGFVARTGGACNVYQDGVVDCCESGGALICPAVAPAE